MDGRLQDVLALIQVLAFDPLTHRSLQGLEKELQGNPRSAKGWDVIARDHPEFFRVAENGKSTDMTASLVARHVIPQQHGTRPIEAEFVATLLQTAIDLHDRQVRRDERWSLWIPIWVALIAGVFALASEIVGLITSSTHCVH